MARVEKEAGPVFGDREAMFNVRTNGERKTVFLAGLPKIKIGKNNPGELCGFEMKQALGYVRKGWFDLVDKDGDPIPAELVFPPEDAEEEKADPGALDGLTAEGLAGLDRPGLIDLADRAEIKFRSNAKDETIRSKVAEAAGISEEDLEAALAALDEGDEE